MLKTVYFLILVVFISCETREVVETLGEYEIAFKPEAQKVYTFIQRPGGDTLIHVYKFSSEAQKSYLQKIYINGEIKYERYYRYSGNGKELIKEYSYESSGRYYKSYNKLEGEIQDYQNIDFGKKYKGHKVKISFLDADGFRTVRREEDQDVEETWVKWRGDSIPALKFYSVNSMKRMIKYLPFIQKGENYKGEAYFAKGIGLIENHAIYEDEHYILKLISIDSVFHYAKTPG